MRLPLAALCCGLPAILAVAAGAAPRPRPPVSRPAATPASAAAGYAVLERRCLSCHSGARPLGELDLATLQGALRGRAGRAALVPGRPQEGLLLRAVAGQGAVRMPPAGPLPAAEVAALRSWVAAGAHYPTGARAAPAGGRWWSFRPVRLPPVPATRDPWVRNPIDAFILARLATAGLQPAPEADRRTLLRRVSFDLTGLPPTPEELAEFAADTRPDAYERVVDRLLASPRYGERWARHWLDLARYAESEGFKADEPRPDAWRYRDYVIRSLNEDRPYDRFVREQLAGDELAPEDPDALIATGFNRHYADESNARNLALRRQEILNDITDTVASVFLGLTLGCARCHDHKYDPLSHRDYYRFQAYFAAVRPRTDLPLAPAAERAEHARRTVEWEAATRAARERLQALEAPHRARLMVGKRMPFPPEVQVAIDTPPAQRTALQWQLFLKVEPQLAISADEVGKVLPGPEKETWNALRRELEQQQHLLPPPLPVALGIADVGGEAPPTHVLSVGNHEAPLEEVAPGIPQAVGGEAPRIVPPYPGTTGRRLALARWIASRENPLTARVMVNRLWQGHFGRGLAAEASDLGRTGERPTHPELLDWLAAIFTAPRGAHGGYGAAWRLKPLHRLMVTSATYRQAAAHRPAAAARDPENLLLWRFRPRRLEGEAYRDAALQVSGELNLEAGGPSVFPELPEGLDLGAGWRVSADAAQRNRRSIYVFVKRNQRYPLFEAFDFPDTHESCSRRNVTTTAPQALQLLNGELLHARGRAFAARLAREAATPAARVERAYLLAFGRRPSPEEAAAALQFLHRQAALAGAPSPAALPPAWREAPAAGLALADFCHALLTSNEFLHVD